MNIVNIIGLALNVGVLAAINTKKGTEIVKNKTARTFITIGSLAGSVWFTYKSAKDIQSMIQNAKYGSENVDSTTVEQSDTGELIDLKTTAADIHDSFYNNDWFGVTEDEERAIAALQSVPIEHMKRLAQIYNNIYGEILKQDFVAFLSSEELNRVKPQLAAM
jgi:hypothetical protein